MADRAFAESRRNGRGGGGVRCYKLNYKLTHVKQNLSQNNFSKQAFRARVPPFLLKRYIELRRLFEENCEKRLLFFSKNTFSYHADKETRRILPLNAPRHLPETRRYLTRVAPLFSPVLVFFFPLVHARARVCVIFSRGHRICRYSVGHYAG